MHIVTISEDEREILRHSLGLTNSRKSYRNYFNAEPGHSYMPILLSLIEKGLMVQNRRKPEYFHVTEAGEHMAGEDSQP